MTRPRETPINLGVSREEKAVISDLNDGAKICSKEGFTPILVNSYYPWAKRKVIANGKPEMSRPTYYDANGNEIIPNGLYRSLKNIQNELVGWEILPLREVVEALKEEDEAGWQEDHTSIGTIFNAALFSHLTDEAYPFEMPEKPGPANPFGPGKGYLKEMDKEGLTHVSERILKVTRAAKANSKP